jgi:hypothetical protein
VLAGTAPLTLELPRHLRGPFGHVSTNRSRASASLPKGST